MNILIANTQEFDKKIGGVERISVDLAGELISMNYNIFFLAAHKSGYENVYELPCEQLILKNNKILSQENIMDFRNYIIEKKIDIVLNQAGNIYSFTKLCVEACKNNSKLISKIHISPKYMIDIVNNNCDSKINHKSKILKLCKLPLNLLQLYKMNKLYSYVYNKSDITVLLSENFKEEYIKYSKVKESNKLKYIPNYTKFDIQKVSNKENILLYAGRLEFFQKRPDRIIEIWEGLYKDYPNWKLRIAGNGPDELLLKNYVRKKGIENIEFLGFCDLNKEYESAEILCMTSSFEGFGLVLIEGAANGCIPVAYDSFKSLNDIIDTEVDGYIIKSFSKDDYRNCLENLMRNENLRNKIREKTYEINKKFKKEKILNQWSDLFENLKSKEDNYEDPSN